MTPRRACAAAAGAAALLALLTLLTLLFVPDRELKGVLERGAARQGYTVTATGFGKAFPLGIRARRLELAGDKGPLLVLENLSIRLNPLPLLWGKVQWHCAARIGGGELTGDVTASGAGALHLEGSNVWLEDIPWFKTGAGAQVKGKLGLYAEVSGLRDRMSGSVRLEVKGADLKGVAIGGTPLPDAGFDTVRGALKITGGTATLESFALQGPAMYVRLKGTVTLADSPAASPLAMTLELMPKPEFLDQQKLVFLLLARYLVTPGQYEVPIGGTLAAPLLR